MRRASQAACGLILAGLVVLSYAVSLRGEFVWDDRPLIVENRLVRDPGSLSTLLTSSFWQTGDRHDRFRSFFRPVVSASYAADYALWGLHPLGFRLTNLLIHFVCCWLVFSIAWGEGLSARASLAGAALFAVHPVHVESVAWISGRTDLFCAAFFFGAFLSHRRADRSEHPLGWRALSLMLFSTALFSKEMAATLPLLVGLDRLLAAGKPRDRIRASLFGMGPYLAVFAVYMLVRHQVLGPAADPLFPLTPISRVATTLFVLARYTTLLVLPAGLDAHYPYAPLETLTSPVVLIAAALLAVVGWVAWRTRRRDPESSFWVLWIFVTLLPVLTFGSFGDILLADRFLYIPSVGVSLLLARWLAHELTRSRLGARGWAFAASTACVVLGLVIPCAARSRMWRDDLALFSRMAETSPDSAMVRCNLGLAYYHRSEYPRAMEEMETAIRLVPGYALAHNNLAAALEREGRLAEALKHYETALALAPRQIESRINIGSLQVRLGKPGKGLRALREVVEDHPRYAEALYAYAEALDRVGARDKALPWLKRTLALDPDYPATHYMLGKIAFETGQKAEAAARMRRFLDLWHEPGVYVDAARRVITLAEAGEGSHGGAPQGAAPPQGGPTVVSR